MIGNTHLFLGGARSGKSALALSWANGFGQGRFFLATAEALDKEMAERIALHQVERAQYSLETGEWKTVEEPLDIALALRRLEGRADIVLLDCLTMWVSNQVLYQERNRLNGPADCVESGNSQSTADVSQRVLAEFADFCAVLKSFSGAVALVSNELGLGLVPENSLGRMFRDLAGKVNQMAAESCAQVTFVAAGLPLPLKRDGRAQALI